MGRSLICFSHLRWDHVYQRPNHLMSRAAQERSVHFVEEPVHEAAGTAPSVEIRRVDGVRIVRFHVPSGLSPAAENSMLASLLHRLVREQGLERPIAWYYTPMALAWSDGLASSIVVYDCMDELSAFRGAPPGLVELEHRLLARADLVFTGGRQLYEAKRGRHPRVHCFPSSVDRHHFGLARRALPEPVDQVGIPRPRLGYFGVIDERIDLELIDHVATTRPDWQLVLVGPLAKLDPEKLPDRPNIHRLGMKSYGELPRYLAGWDVAIMPFALNEATRFISPTKTPEYLAGGRPVVATPIADVVEPYGTEGLAAIAATPADFVAAVERALRSGPPNTGRIDAFLAESSWDRTWSWMAALIERAELAVLPVVAPARSQTGTARWGTARLADGSAAAARRRAGLPMGGAARRTSAD